MHVYQCANCGGWFEGAAWLPSNTPRDRYGRAIVARLANPPQYCSESCREQHEYREEP